MQDADFWCRRDFRCKAVQSGDSAQKVAGVYYDPALQVRPFRYKISAAPFTGRDGHTPATPARASFPGLWYTLFLRLENKEDHGHRATETCDSGYL